MVKYGGVGRHMTALVLSGERDKIVVWAKCLLATGWLYLAAVTLPKLCVLVLYHRIFDMRRIRWSCYVLAVIMIANFLTGGIVGMVACRPISYLWDRTIPGGKCINVSMFFLWIGFPNIITDFAVLILPLPIIVSLKFPLLVSPILIRFSGSSKVLKHRSLDYYSHSQQEVCKYRLSSSLNQIFPQFPNQTPQ